MKHTKTTVTQTPTSVTVTEGTTSVSDRLKEALFHTTEVTNTKTQQTALAREIKFQLGVLRRGRPVDFSSTRQERLAELDKKRAAGELKLGRPKCTETERVKAEQEKRKRAEKEAAQIRKIAEEMLAMKA